MKALDMAGAYDFLVQQFHQLASYYYLYVPLGVIGSWRWGVWIIKYLAGRRYRPIVSNKTMRYSVSIITPVYKEDPNMFKKALYSWAQNEPDEIIAVIDYGELECIRIFEEFSRETDNAHLIVTQKSGKRNALADGINAATGNIVALVDSDTIWEKNVKDISLAAFADDSVAGVSTRQRVINPQNIWQKVTDMLWESRNSVDFPAQVASSAVVSCLSGRTAFYRKEIILPHLDYFLNEIIFGRKKESGDDKCLTRIVHRQGWHSYFQGNALVYSSGPHDFRTFWKQRVRWTRNSYNSDIQAMREGWLWKYPFLAFFLIDRFISPFTVLISPIIFSLAFYFNHWSPALAILILWIVGRAIRNWSYLLSKPTNIKIIPLYVFLTFVLAVARIYSLVTIRNQLTIRDQDTKRRTTSTIAVGITILIIAGIVILITFLVGVLK